MKVLDVRHFGADLGDFSLYLLGTQGEGEVLPADDATHEERWEFLHNRFDPVLELTYNHGTEDQPNFKYANGN